MKTLDLLFHVVFLISVYYSRNESIFPIPGTFRKLLQNNENFYPASSCLHCGSIFIIIFFYIYLLYSPYWENENSNNYFYCAVPFKIATGEMLINSRKDYGSDARTGNKSLNTEICI